VHMHATTSKVRNLEGCDVRDSEVRCLNDLCILSSLREYPALKGLLPILREILKPRKLLVVTSSQSSLAGIFQYVYSELYFFLTLIGMLRKHRNVEFLLYQAVVPLTCLIMKLLKKRVLLFMGGSSFKARFYDSSTFFSKIRAFCMKIFESICFKLSDKIIVLSKGMVNSIGLTSHSQKVFVAPDYPHGLLTRFHSRKAFMNRDMVVGFVGNLARSKAPHLLVKSMPSVISNFKETKLLIIGDGPMRKAIEDLVRLSSIQANVKILGRVPHVELAAYYNEMRLLVIPSYTEGLPAVALEAMTCSTPVLATPVGAIPDIITDGETGFLLNGNHPQEIAARIIELFQNPELLKKVGNNAPLSVRKTFKRSAIESAWKNIFPAKGYGV